MNVVLKLSKLCNLRCTYCYEYAHLADASRMPAAGLARFLDSLGDALARADTVTEVRFALHGGEPLLLPPEYLRQIVALQRRYLGGRRIPFRNSVQTNLYRVRQQTLQACAELDIGIGVSLDVHGDARVDAQGSDSQERVAANLRELVHSTRAAPLRLGGISVLHAGNAARAADTFRFWAELELDYRILPIFSIAEPPARMRELMLAPEQVAAALLDVHAARLSWTGRRIRVQPLDDHLEAAIRAVMGVPGRIHDPDVHEWALIVDTCGDAYAHAEAYVPEYRLGNVFAEPVAAVLGSAGRSRLREARRERIAHCERCEFGRFCNRLPLVEALPSERQRDASGRPRCGVAQPVIAQMRQWIATVPQALAALREVA